MNLGLAKLARFRKFYNILKASDSFNIRNTFVVKEMEV